MGAQFKVVITILITMLSISALSNYFLYKEMQSKSELLTKSEQTEQLAIGKNGSLAAIIEEMKSEKKNSQASADKLQKEIFELKKESGKTEIVIKEIIKNEPCDNVAIPWPDDFRLHYN